MDFVWVGLAVAGLVGLSVLHNRPSVWLPMVLGHVNERDRHEAVVKVRMREAAAAVGRIQSGRRAIHDQEAASIVSSLRTLSDEVDQWPVDGSVVENANSALSKIEGAAKSLSLLAGACGRRAASTRA